ncbi:hypothetical protein L3Y34_019389 [Caenorhabditis briggsae]|uniref:Uncharacterized protein n=1 Tax=Caenorhabditis briggsae TaxID=6238 RepID=A0AAE9IWM1_CAEBR|nr:hypothetical protein L3Y34_019389 [Caenorhabditis briggsae]
MNQTYVNGPYYYDPLQQVPYVSNPESVYWESIPPVSDQMYQNWNHWEPYPMSVDYPMPVLTPMFPVHEGNSAPRDPSSAQAPQHQRPNPQQPQEIARIHSKAVGYCENCPVYWDDKIVNLFRYFFDPSNPGIHQTVKVYHPKNGRSIFKDTPLGNGQQQAVKKRVDEKSQKTRSSSKGSDQSGMGCVHMNL